MLKEFWDNMWEKIVIVVLLLFIVFKGCGTYSDEPQDIEVERYTDTTYVTHIDTLFFRKDTTVTKTVLSYTNITLLPSDSSKLYTFENHVDDSLITGDIKTRVKIKDNKATLLSQELAYIAKFPKYIHQIDSVFIRDSIIVTKLDDKMGIFLGAEFGYGPNGTLIAPTLALQFKNKSIIEAGYDPFNKQIIIGTKIKLTFKHKSKNGIFFR